MFDPKASKNYYTFLKNLQFIRWDMISLSSAVLWEKVVDFTISSVICLIFAPVSFRLLFWLAVSLRDNLKWRLWVTLRH